MKWFCAIVTLVLLAQRQPEGVISGRAVDDEGRPMRGAEVQAFALGYPYGTRQLTPRGNTASTNDRGEFRVFRLESGVYYLAVHPNPVHPNPLPFSMTARPQRLPYIPSDPDATFVMTYFPGTPDVRRAEAITVASGEVDVHAIQVASLPARSIRFRVVNWPGGPNGEGSVGFYPLADYQTLPISQATTAIGFGKDVVLIRTGLNPGQYRIRLSISTPVGLYLGSAPLTLEGYDPDVVSMQVTRAMPLAGKVVTEPGAPGGKVLFFPAPSNPSGIPAMADIRQNGRFVAEGIVPGAYAVSVSGLESGAYLASVTVQGQKVAPENVVVPKDIPSMDLALIIKRDGGSISGVVVDDTGAARSNVTVSLIPDAEARTQRDLYRFAISNSQGEFEIRGIAPGSYTLGTTPIRISPGKHLDLGAVELR